MAPLTTHSIAADDLASLRHDGAQDAFLIFGPPDGGALPLDGREVDIVQASPDYRTHVSVRDSNLGELRSDASAPALDGINNSGLTLDWRSDWMLSAEPFGAADAGTYHLGITTGSGLPLSAIQLTGLDFGARRDVFSGDAEVFDAYFAGRGADILSGQGGDVLSGGDGRDRIALVDGGYAYGGDGGDRIAAEGVGGDSWHAFSLHGEAGRDVIDASGVSRGEVFATGGAGADRITGGADGDLLFGGAGADRLDGGAGGDDWLEGQDGRDRAKKKLTK
jgi:Ca2+-binding RTX toxin-like protein